MAAAGPPKGGRESGRLSVGQRIRLSRRLDALPDVRKGGGGATGGALDGRELVPCHSPSNRISAAGTPRSLPARLFPADNWWNLNISKAPVDPKSANYIAALASAREPQRNARILLLGSGWFHQGAQPVLLVQDEIGVAQLGAGITERRI